MGDGEGLPVGRRVGEPKHDQRLRRALRRRAAALERRPRPPDEDVGEGVVEAEVGVGHEVERDGDLRRGGGGGATASACVGRDASFDP